MSDFTLAMIFCLSGAMIFGAIFIVSEALKKHDN
jgi:Na+-translocating ferredoxin:NAD+ oxidoreductase RnfD subunit